MCINKHNNPHSDCISVLQSKLLTIDQLTTYKNCIKRFDYMTETIRGKRDALNEYFFKSHQDFCTWVCVSLAAIICVIGILFVIRHKFFKARVRLPEKEYTLV